MSGTATLGVANQTRRYFKLTRKLLDQKGHRLWGSRYLRMAAKKGSRGLDGRATQRRQGCSLSRLQTCDWAVGVSLWDARAPEHGSVRSGTRNQWRPIDKLTISMVLSVPTTAPYLVRGLLRRSMRHGMAIRERKKIWKTGPAGSVWHAPDVCCGGRLGCAGDPPSPYGYSMLHPWALPSLVSFFPASSVNRLPNSLYNPRRKGLVCCNTPYHAISFHLQGRDKHHLAPATRVRLVSQLHCC